MRELAKSDPKGRLGRADADEPGPAQGMSDLRKRFAAVMQGFATGKVVAQLVEQVSERNEQAVGRQLVRLGLSPAKRPNLSAATNAATADNTRLIKNIPDEMADRIAGKVRAGWDAGKRHETLAKELEAEFGIAGRRARLIARDQVNKINGSFTEARHRAAGITHYRWQSGKDSRVRPAHLALNGKVFSWDDPSSEGHPGQPIQCRCTAAPVTSEREIARAARHPVSEADLRQAQLKPRHTAQTAASAGKRLLETEYGKRMIEVGEARPEVVQAAAEQLALVDPSIIERLSVFGVKVVPLEGSPDNDPTVAAARKRAAEIPGSTQAQMAKKGRKSSGSYVPGAKRAAVLPFEKPGAGSSVLHEVGHAYEYTFPEGTRRLSDRSAWQDTLAAGNEGLFSRYPVVVTKALADSLESNDELYYESEMLAETFVIFHTDPAGLKESAPKIFEFWKARVVR